MVLVIDNYDSFTYNLARYLEELGEEVTVRRNDAISVDEVRGLHPTHIVLSPGPCTPMEAGITLDTIRAYAGVYPILGICLGHQAIGLAFGARLVRAERLLHGKTSLIHHTGRGVFRGLPSPFSAARYHSLILDPASIRGELELTARTEQGEVMGIVHRRLAVVGLQFHPESILSEHGHDLLACFLQTGYGEG